MASISHEVWINAARPTVFEAITSRAGLDAWWGIASSVEQGVGATIEFDHGLGSPLRMQITEFAPETRLVWECVSEFADAANPASDCAGPCAGVRTA